MKHYIDQIVQQAALSGITVSRDTAERMLRHLEHVIAANDRVRLTAIDTIERGVRLHILDSLVALPEVRRAPEGSCADLGTGGGYPGIPLALATGRHFSLFDSVQKKVAAVKEFTATEHLDDGIGLYAIRAEEAASDEMHRAKYAVVVARALSALPSLIELAAPLMQPSGHFIAMKGRLDGDELSRGDAVADLLGLKRVSVREAVLPGGDEVRTIVAYERVRDSSVRLPRRTGLAQRKPLA